MKLNRHWVLAFAFFLFACQPSNPPTITIIDNDQVIALQTDERTPLAILARVDIHPDPDDRILLNGFPIALNKPISDHPIILQLRRAITVTLVTPQGQQTFQTSALTVGEALQQAGIQLYTTR